MATCLDDYQSMKDTMTQQFSKGNLSLEQSMMYQELLYRIGVLETCRVFCKMAPITTEMKALVAHYQMVDAYVQCIGKERRFGMPADDKEKAKRKVAADALEKTVADCRKRFSSFQPSGQDMYKRSISMMLNTILPVWLQLRNTYVPIRK
jgi:hypothetical protein